MSSDEVILNDDPWSVFVEPIIHIESCSSNKPNQICRCNLQKLWTNNRLLTDAHWQWISDLVDLMESNYEAMLDVDFQSVIIHFRLIASEYWIRLGRSAEYPMEMPELESSLQGAFQLQWYNESNLVNICEQFAECCNIFDSALMECTELDYPFKFISWNLHPDEMDCIEIVLEMIVLEFEKSETSNSNVTLRMAIEWQNPSSFPRYMECPIKNIIKSERFGQWDTNLPFRLSLRRLFGVNDMDDY